MRCPKCGLPISPKNTSMICPRCGPNLGSSSAPIRFASPQQTEQGWGRRGTIDAPVFPSAPQTPQVQQTPQPDQLWLPGPSDQQTPAASGQGQDLAPARGATTRSSAPRRPPQKTNAALLIAGICVVLGAVILIFVSVMAAGLQSSSSTNNSTPTTDSHPTPAADTPTAAPSPSPTYPAQHFIDNAQMASSVDTNTAKPTKLASTFKAGDQIYVTFNIHPDGHSGEVCLLWYSSTSEVTHYSYPVSPATTAGYSYAIYGTSATGAASVEIYWASTSACTDKSLAQRVNFTVTG